ncbi:hypothetical protein DFH11DRAFT_1513714 [Phellopilus nigrolimitatus]|nr:hypothetical protein DFH11DRAFT_1513714 [Phellopilus nigrolimitatus]
MPYVFHRSALYSLLYAASVVELGLTGFRIHHTKSTAGFYDPIVVELLVTSALTLLWIPVTVFAHLRGSRNAESSGFAPLHGESGGNFVLWVLWLVGGAIITHKFPNATLAGGGKEGHILLTIVAFAWIAFSALSLGKIFVLLQYATLKAEGAGTAETRKSEKA